MKNAGFYHLSFPVILASGSVARQQLLQPVFPDLITRPCPEEVEDALKERHAEAEPADLAVRLAEGKALSASSSFHQYAIIGGDQICELDGKMLSKQHTPEGALAQLRALQGKTHQLHSGAAIARDGELLASFCVTATLTMTSFSDSALTAYIETEKPFKSVSSYLYEGLGRHLFTEINGDYETILGLPVNELLKHMRTLDLLS